VTAFLVPPNTSEYTSSPSTGDEGLRDVTFFFEISFKSCDMVCVSIAAWSSGSFSDQGLRREEEVSGLVVAARLLGNPFGGHYLCMTASVFLQRSNQHQGFSILIPGDWFCFEKPYQDCVCCRRLGVITAYRKQTQLLVVSLNQHGTIKSFAEGLRSRKAQGSTLSRLTCLLIPFA
jgi:hypothetical protein